MKKTISCLLLALIFVLTLSACSKSDESATEKTVDVGDYYTFGSYEQDNNTSNGKEPIEWLVLEKQGNRVLLISKYALDNQPYNAEFENTSWEHCTLREWLNSDFLNSAFSDEEKNLILNAEVSADDNLSYSTNAGNSTVDKVFLLSVDEVEKYLRTDSARECEPTAYAVANGGWKSGDNGNCWWKLRTPGRYKNYSSCVYSDGTVNTLGYSVADKYGTVRPAILIELN